MTEQSVALIVGFLVVVGLRLLDWAFPKGYTWKKIKDWSTKVEDEDKVD